MGRGSAGFSAPLSVFEPNGAPWAKVAPNGPGNIPVPPFGHILIDPSSSIVLAPGTITPPSGTTVTVNVPPNPALAGFSVWWQALIVEPAGPRLTGAVVTTVLWI